MKNILHRVTAFSLAICMVVTLLFAGVVHTASAEATDFDVMLGRLEMLEQLASSYRDTNRVSTSADLLMMRYIRAKRYSSTSWTLLAGSPDDNFKAYAESHEPDVAALQDIGSLALPNGDVTDFVHMCATINTIISGNGDIGGWIGDTCQLVLDIQSESGDTEQLAEKAKLHFRSGGHFGREDWVGDMDAYNLHSIKSSSETWAACFARYYGSGTPTEKQRVAAFIQKNWGASYAKETSSKAAYRTLVKSRYGGSGIMGTIMMTALKSSVFGSNIPEDKYHDAACYAVADYMFDTIHAPVPDETNVRIDFEKETLEIAAGIVVNSAEDFTGVGYENGDTISPGTTFYARGVRDTEAGSFIPSEVVAFTAPQRPTAPDAPVLVSADAGSLRFAQIENAEYSLDGVIWQDSPDFTDLTPNTAYRVICRYRSSDSSFASEPSQAADCSTALPADLYVNSRGFYYAAGEHVGGMMAAGYDADGRMRSAQMATLANGLWQYALSDAPAEQTLRVFVLDAAFAPLRAAYTAPKQP